MGLSEQLGELWEKADPDEVYDPVPAGVYKATIIKGEFGNNKNNTPYYRLTYRIDEGEPHAGRLVWLDRYWTPKAINRTKADLLRIGLQSREDLKRPLPHHVRCTVRVAVHAGDDGREWNEVRSFDVIELVTPQPDPFAGGSAG